MIATSCEDMLRAMPDWPVVGSFVEVEWNSVGGPVLTRGEWNGRACDNNGAPGFALHEYGSIGWTAAGTPGSITYKPYRSKDRIVRFFSQGSLLSVTVLVEAIPPITETEERRVIKGLRKIVGTHGTD